MARDPLLLLIIRRRAEGSEIGRMGYEGIDTNRIIEADGTPLSKVRAMHIAECPSVTIRLLSASEGVTEPKGE